MRPAISAATAQTRKTPAAAMQIEAEVSQYRANRADKAEHANRGNHRVAIEAAQREHSAGGDKPRGAVGEAAVLFLLPEPRQIAGNSEEEQRPCCEPAVEHTGERALLPGEPARGRGHRRKPDREKQEHTSIRFRAH